MDECNISSSTQECSFQEIYDAMNTDKYWINFFIRPCCPPPSAEQAKSNLSKRRDEVAARSDFSPEQKSQLLAIIDAREQWYMASPFCKG